MSQSGQGTGDAGQTILVYNVMLDPWKKHPIRVSSKAHPTVLPLGIFSLLLAAFSCPARVPPLLSTQVLFGGVEGVPSQNLSLSFPFPCGSCSSCDLPGPACPLGPGSGPLPAFLSPRPFLHSFYSWLEQPLSLSNPGKGLSCWSRGWGQEPRRKPVPEAPVPSWSPQLTAG